MTELQASTVESATLRPRLAVRLRGETLYATIVLAVALVQGLAYMLIMPPWQHYDEPTHFEYAWLIANRTWNPTDADMDLAMRRETATSMIRYGFYRDLPQPDLSQTDATQIWIGVSELGKSPLYYTVVALPLMLVRGFDIVTQLYVARSVSLLLFVVTILAVYGLARDLAPPRHPLRWLVPISVALVPPFADLMTAVNSDVGAVTALTVLLWGLVRTIRFGFTLRRILWIVASTIVCATVKDTSVIGIVLAPIGLVIAFWAQRGWRWWPFFVAGAVGFGVASIALFGWGDARYWYRWGGLDLSATTQTSRPDAVLGTHVVAIQAAEGPKHQVLNGVSDADAVRLAGRTVTVGSWMWAERPVSRVELGIVVSPRGTLELNVLATPLELTTTPTFYTHSVTVPENVGKLYFVVFARGALEGEQPTPVYIDGAVLMEGEQPALPPPAFDDHTAASGTWNGQPFLNPLRNASGEMAWPRVRPWFMTLMPRLINVERLWIFSTLFDLGTIVPFTTRVATQWVLYGFFVRFSWGQLWLPSSLVPAVLFQGWTILALVGCVIWWARRRASDRLRPALVFLAIAALSVWVTVSMWPLSYFVMSRVTLPSSRYAFPVAAPTMLMLVGGWWALWPRRWRAIGIGVVVVAMLALNAISIVTILSYYRGIA